MDKLILVLYCSRLTQLGHFVRFIPLLPTLARNISWRATVIDGKKKQLYHVCPPVRKIIHSLKLVDYLHVPADNPWYNYYLDPYPEWVKIFFKYACDISSGS